MQKRIPTILPWSLVALGAIALIFFAIADKKQNDTDEEMHEHEEAILLTTQQIEDAGIQIDSAKAGVLQVFTLSPGKVILNADRVTHIYPKVSGIAKEARKNLGEKVKNLETLAILESKEVAEIKTAYLSALQKEKYAQTLLQQEQNLQDKGLTTLQDYEGNLNSHKEALLALEAAKQNLYAIGLTQKEIANLVLEDASTMRFYELRAPFEGSILSRHITAGELLSPSSEVYTIGDLNKLWLDISIYPNHFTQLAKGQMIAIRDVNAKEGQAELLYICPVIDEETHRLQAIAQLDNSSGQWQPGTYITAIIPNEAVPVELAISKNGVQKIDGQECVFIANEEGFEIRPITTGRSDEEYIEVTSGIELGERYAVSNSFLLKAEHEKDEAEHMH